MALLLALAQQQRLHKPRVFRDRTQPLDCMDDDELISRYRLPRMCITELCDLLATELQRTTARSCALPVSTQVLVALRFYATGSMQRVAGDLHGISQPSVSRCVHAVSRLLTCNASSYIKFPTDESSQRKTMADFYKIAAFPNVLGCVDGTQIPILSPAINENIYVCRKGFHSLNVQAICNAQMCFINIVAKYPGSAHDSFIWRNCALCSVSISGTAHSRASAMAAWRQRLSLVSIPNDTNRQSNETSGNKLQQEAHADTKHRRAFIWPSEDAVSLSTQHWWLPAVSARTLCTDHHCMCRVAQHVYQQRSSRSRRAQPVTHQW